MCNIAFIILLYHWIFNWIDEIVFYIVSCYAPLHSRRERYSQVKPYLTTRIYTLFMCVLLYCTSSMQSSSYIPIWCIHSLIIVDVILGWATRSNALPYTLWVQCTKWHSSNLLDNIIEFANLLAVLCTISTTSLWKECSREKKDNWIFVWNCNGAMHLRQSMSMSTSNYHA